MSYFCDNLKNDSFSFNFGENVLFTQSYYEGYPPSNSAPYWCCGCNNFNAPIKIPNTLVNAYDFLGWMLPNFNSPIYISPNHPNLVDMSYLCYNLANFNQDINIPENVFNAYYMLYECHNFNSNVYCYTSTGMWDRNPYNLDNARNNFDGYCQGWGGNFNIHFINSYPQTMRSTFAGCSNLNKNITIPPTVTEAWRIFAYCENFNQNVIFPDGTNVQGAFVNCNGINRTVHIPRYSDISYMFANCAYFNASMYVPVCRGTNISEQEYNSYELFANCYNLNSSIVFEEGYKILRATFHRCTNFNAPITLPSTLETLYETFYGCSNFNRQLSFGSSLKNLYDAFEFCTNLNIDMALPEGLEIMHGTFWGCYNLNQNIQIPSTVTDMSGCFSACSNLNQNIAIPAGVTNIDTCFRMCNNLDQNIALPSVVSLNNTFNTCVNLNQSISIPSTVTDMGSTFINCHNLNSVITLPSGLKSLNYGFCSCRNYRQPIVVPHTCHDLQSAFAQSGINNVNFQCDEIHFWTSSGRGTPIAPFSFVSSWQEYNEETGQLVANHPCLDTTGFQIGDTIAEITFNKDCLYYYSTWESVQEERHYNNTQEVFFDTSYYLNFFVGISSGRVGGRYREQNQARNYSDYMANYAGDYHNNCGSVFIYSRNYDAGLIQLKYSDWANATSSSTPNYYINFYFV